MRKPRSIIPLLQFLGLHSSWELPREMLAFGPILSWWARTGMSYSLAYYPALTEDDQPSFRVNLAEINPSYPELEVAFISEASTAPDAIIEAALDYFSHLHGNG